MIRKSQVSRLHSLLTELSQGSMAVTEVRQMTNYMMDLRENRPANLKEGSFEILDLGPAN